MEFCFLTGGLLLGLFFADRSFSCSVFSWRDRLLGSWRTDIFLLCFPVGRPACLVRGGRASSCSFFLSAGNSCTVFLQTGMILLSFSVGSPACLIFFADRASSCSVFLSADSLPTKDGDIEYARLPAYKGRGI